MWRRVGFLHCQTKSIFLALSMWSNEVSGTCQVEKSHEDQTKWFVQGTCAISGAGFCDRRVVHRVRLAHTEAICESRKKQSDFSPPPTEQCE
mmetsp:Transcript_19545/g.31028  ORF Transcript_19545/g.31028 Transcript_19545/m.31028 type:complete len:92 (+) Transcript_19545:75-350(+)